MKKFITLTALVLGASGVFSQGLVDFNNVVFPNNGAGDGTPVNPDRLVYFCFGGPKLVGTFYKAELYYQDANGSFQPVVESLSSFRSATTSYPGTWNGKLSVPLPVGGVGIPVALQVRVWDGTTALTYEEATFRAQSSPFTYIQTQSSPPNPAFDQAIWGFRAFGVALSCPEPSVITFCIACGAGLLLIQIAGARRKEQCASVGVASQSRQESSERGAGPQGRNSLSKLNG